MAKNTKKLQCLKGNAVQRFSPFLCGYVHFCDSYIFVIAEIYLVFSLTEVLWQFQ